MFLVSRRRVSSASRSTAISFWYFSLVGRHARLAVGFLRQRGRDRRSGRRLVLSKGSVAVRGVFKLPTAGLAGLFATSLVVAFQRRPQRRGAVALMCNALGCWFYFSAVADVHMLAFYGVIQKPAPGYLAYVFARWRWPTRLDYFPPHSRICQLSLEWGLAPAAPGTLLPSAQRAFALRAPGTSGLLLAPRFSGDWALLLLPSGQFKVVNALTAGACFGGGFQSVNFAATRQSTAGAGRRRGVAPRVRGTVKNANDHPNGGRSRALRCPRTPWGLVAKKSRHVLLCPVPTGKLLLRVPR